MYLYLYLCTTRTHIYTYTSSSPGGCSSSSSSSRRWTSSWRCPTTSWRGWRPSSRSSRPSSRRVLRLAYLFLTYKQLPYLPICMKQNKTQDFRGKRHDLLDYHNGKFDRDFAEFNARIAELEAALQGFINQVRGGGGVVVCVWGLWVHAPGLSAYLHPKHDRASRTSPSSSTPSCSCGASRQAHVCTDGLSHILMLNSTHPYHNTKHKNTGRPPARVAQVGPGLQAHGHLPELRYGARAGACMFMCKCMSMYISIIQTLPPHTIYICTLSTK